MGYGVYIVKTFYKGVVVMLKMLVSLVNVVCWRFNLNISIYPTIVHKHVLCHYGLTMGSSINGSRHLHVRVYHNRLLIKLGVRPWGKLKNGIHPA